jgi:hypothetical protein
MSKTAGCTVAARTRSACLCFLGLLLLATSFSSHAAPMDMTLRVLDDFDDPTQWQASASDDVKARLFRAAGRAGGALCLAFDFGTVSGYAVARRRLPIEFTGNYELTLALKGDAPANTLQLKLVDASGENVWWVNRPDFDFPRDWETLRFKRRHIGFAWGPTQDRTLKRSAFIELAIVRGRGGGKGNVCLDELTLRALPSTASPMAPRVTATSSFQSSIPAHVIDGDMETVWRSDPGAAEEQSLTLDFGAPRELGGLVLQWAPGTHATRYAIEYSDDGERWRTVRQVAAGNGGKDPHLLSESETRYIRLRMQKGNGHGYGLTEVEVKDVEWGASPNAFFEALAKAAPRGHYPRAFWAEQTYWTVLGSDGDERHGLLSEDGAVEPAPRSPSVEPLLLLDGTVVTWADVSIEHELRDGYLPLPRVTWRGSDWALHVTAFAAASDRHEALAARYALENRSDRIRRATLALAIRPFQVNPPSQFLNVPGGVAPIRELKWDGKAIAVNGRPMVYTLEPPQGVMLTPFDAGNVPELLAEGAFRESSALIDETGFASGVLLYRIDIPPREQRTIGVVLPRAGVPDRLDPARGWLERAEGETAETWREKLNRVALHLPPDAQHIAHTVRTALAHVLASRAGAALQPGTRAYARSWIRDGAMMSDALSRMGHAAVAREYAEWFAPYQFSNGKVPCCVDDRGADPVAENDSHGAFIYLIAQHYRYSADQDWLRRMWPRVDAAARYMNGLRLSERTARNHDAERRAYYGLMPPSISHEGYSDKPAYSYWDDFWTLAGYDGALEIARALHRAADAKRLSAQRQQFRDDLVASIRESLARYRIDYIPGAADRGDYDPTSTTIALSIGDMQSDLPQHALHATFERYWAEFLTRRNRANWNDYTPYELRNVGAFARLGWRQRIDSLLEFFHGDRRPRAWNQWAEVVGREPRTPRFIGDMPHGWVASDYINAVLDLFAYERRADRALVLAAGIPEPWLEGEGIGITHLRTPYGVLTYRLRRQAGELMLEANGTAMPPGGLVLAWPYAGRPGRAMLDGQALHWEGDRELRIRTLPARVRIEVPGNP